MNFFDGVRKVEGKSTLICDRLHLHDYGDRRAICVPSRVEAPSERFYDIFIRDHLLGRLCRLLINDGCHDGIGEEGWEGVEYILDPSWGYATSDWAGSIRVLFKFRYHLFNLVPTPGEGYGYL